MTRRQSGSVISALGASFCMPELATTMSTPPNAATVWSNRRITAASSETSAPMASAEPPASLISRASASAGSGWLL